MASTASSQSTASSAGAPAPAAPPAHAVRVGIVGAGKMAQHHARAVLRSSVPARLVAVADPSPDAVQAMRAIAPVAAYDTLDALLAAEPLDVVHICTPPETHEALALAALRAGCHVYVEKPFAHSVQSARRVLELAASRGLKVCAGHQLLYEAPAREAARLLPALGQLTHVESYFSFRTVRRAPGGRVPLRADLQLLDILPHPVYVLLQFLESSGPGRTELTALELGPAGTVHALVRRGALTGSLTVTLEGRPVESYLRLVGTNGMVYADFVRSTVQRLIGPGTSGIDKLLAPYRLAMQLLGGTTAALARRFLARQRSYPGLVEIFEAFYSAVHNGAPSPISAESILETVRIWERVAQALEESQATSPAAAAPPAPEPEVVVTGGTGFLGRALVRSLAARGAAVRVLARRTPAGWEREEGVEYVVADLSRPLPKEVLGRPHTVIHAAAETAGGWEEHQRNSLDATEHVVRAAAEAGVKRLIHVSSLAVLANPRGSRPVADDDPLEPNSRGLGPYVWGKLESERLAVRLGRELGVAVKVVRPGALVDYDNFDPPGRLGKRIGNVFVAVGAPSHTLGVVDVGFTADTLAWMLDHFESAPDRLNVLAPKLPTKGELVARLRRSNPDLRVVWLPTAALVPLSWAALGLQKALRPGRPAINVAKVFARQRYDTSRIAALAPGITREVRAPSRASQVA